MPGGRWSRWLIDDLWAPVEAAFLMVVVGAVGILAHQPWLFPSLGPTAFVLAEYPQHRVSRVYHVVGGHLAGLLAAIVAVRLIGAQHSPTLPSSGHIGWPRVWAAALALLLTIVLELLLHASHPPAASTAMIVALGGFPPTAAAAGDVIVGVLIVAALGELFRRIRASDGEEPPGEPADGTEYPSSTQPPPG